MHSIQITTSNGGFCHTVVFVAREMPIWTWSHQFDV